MSEGAVGNKDSVGDDADTDCSMTEEESWRGNSMEEIYRNRSPWEYEHLPPIVNKHNHSVLYELPWQADSTEPPVPHKSPLKWDAEHVRLPYSHRNTFLVKLNENSQLQTSQQRWDQIEAALLRPINNSRELEQAILSYNVKYAHKWKLQALHILFEEVLDEAETEGFFANTMPAIIRLALRMPELIPTAIPLLKHGQNKSISLSQQQIACLLANAFLCTFPRRNARDEKSEYKNYPSINFFPLYQHTDKAVLEKIKCICSYFTTVCKKVPLGVVTFTRRSLKPSLLPNWETDDSTFDSLIHISTTGTIEEDGIGMLQVDFANKYVGGGVLGFGCVQEEIRFVICPELLVSKLFTERLGSLECLVIAGCEQFNSYTGYGMSFEWTGPYVDKTPFDACGRRKCNIVAIDAINFHSSCYQYEESAMLRELNKAYVGFFHELDTPAPAVATGNWGCGAFNGDKALKSLLQLMVCCVTKRPLVYFTFGDVQLRDDFLDIFHYLSRKGITVSALWSYLRHFHAQKLASEHLYPFIIQSHRDSCSVLDDQHNRSTTNSRVAVMKRPIRTWSSGADTETEGDSSPSATTQISAVIHTSPNTLERLIQEKSKPSLSLPKFRSSYNTDEIEVIESIPMTSNPKRTSPPNPPGTRDKRPYSLINSLNESYYQGCTSKIPRLNDDVIGGELIENSSDNSVEELQGVTDEKDETKENKMQVDLENSTDFFEEVPSSPKSPRVDGIAIRSLRQTRMINYYEKK